MILGAGLSHAAKAEVKVEETKVPGKSESKSSTQFEYTENHPGYELHQSATEKDVSEAESTQPGTNPPDPSIIPPAPVHGEIK